MIDEECNKPDCPTCEENFREQHPDEKEVVFAPVEVVMSGFTPKEFVPPLGARQGPLFGEVCFPLHGGHPTQIIKFSQGRFVQVSLRLNPPAPGGTSSFHRTEWVRDQLRARDEEIRRLRTRVMELEAKS